jgi:hypothetical protein
MKEKPTAFAESHRLTKGTLASLAANGNNGAFRFTRNGTKLLVIISDGGGWDHVSVSCTHRCPTWSEMCWIKNIFFDEDEWVTQYHPAKSDYVNFHANCLHLWRPQGVDVPQPPSWMVGPIEAAANQKGERHGELYGH